ncbi:MAG: phage tail tape measure protein [Xanthobacteraceae bacterium]
MADDDDIDDESITSKLEDVRGRTRELTAGSNAFARAITAAFAQGATGAKSFDSVLKSLALRLSTLSVSMALKPAIGSLFGGSNSALGGLFNGSSSGIGATGTEGAGSIQPFAKGGVIAAPNFFPLGDNRTGLAGEAGPEAIMPLARGPDGRLGVAASGSAAPNVTVNIATPDAESFRRSDVYLTGLIARAVSRGQRRM